MFPAYLKVLPYRNQKDVSCEVTAHGVPSAALRMPKQILAAFLPDVRRSCKVHWLLIGHRLEKFQFTVAAGIMWCIEAMFGNVDAGILYCACVRFLPVEGAKPSHESGDFPDDGSAGIS